MCEPQLTVFKWRTHCMKTWEQTGRFPVYSQNQERLSLRPFGACSFPFTYPQLAPLRQAQGKLWAAFFRRFAAGGLWSHALASLGTDPSTSLRASCVRPDERRGHLVGKGKQVPPLRGLIRSGCSRNDRRSAFRKAHFSRKERARNGGTRRF